MHVQLCWAELLSGTDSEMRDVGQYSVALHRQHPPPRYTKESGQRKCAEQKEVCECFTEPTYTVVCINYITKNCCCFCKIVLDTVKDYIIISKHSLYIKHIEI